MRRSGAKEAAHPCITRAPQVLRTREDRRRSQGELIEAEGLLIQSAAPEHSDPVREEGWRSRAPLPKTTGLVHIRARKSRTRIRRLMYPRGRSQYAQTSEPKLLFATMYQPREFQTTERSLYGKLGTLNHDLENSMRDEPQRMSLKIEQQEAESSQVWKFGELSSRCSGNLRKVEDPNHTTGDMKRCS